MIHKQSSHEGSRSRSAIPVANIKLKKSNSDTRQQDQNSISLSHSRSQCSGSTMQVEKARNISASEEVSDNINANYA